VGLVLGLEVVGVETLGVPLVPEPKTGWMRMSEDRW
jgi:hypothetical protein